jgi:hypothetical protein
MENNRGRYILILKIDVTDKMIDWFPVTLDDSGEITNEKLEIIKTCLLHRWKYQNPPILKQKDFIKEIKNTISESRVFYVPWGITAEIVISNWIDYFYHNKPISPEIEKIFINSKPIENLWQLF